MDESKNFKLGDVVVDSNRNKAHVVGLFSNIMCLGQVNKEGRVDRRSVFSVEVEDCDWNVYSETRYDLLTYTFEDIKKAFDAGSDRVVSVEYSYGSGKLAPDLDEYMRNNYADKVRAIVDA